MALDPDLKADIEILRHVSQEILEANTNGNEKYFNQLGNDYGSIARKIFLRMNNKERPVLLNPWAVAHRAWTCGHCDVGSFEFWNSADMVVALCQFLDSIKEEIYAESA